MPLYRREGIASPSGPKTPRLRRGDYAELGIIATPTRACSWRRALRYYAKWIPSKGRRWVDLLDRVIGVIGAIGSNVGTMLGTRIKHLDESGVSAGPETPDLIGGPSRTRTLDPLIKSDNEQQPEGTQDDLTPREPE